MQPAVAKPPATLTRALPWATATVAAAAFGWMFSSLGALAVMPLFGLLFLGFVVSRPEFGIALFMSTFFTAYPEIVRGSGFLTINNLLGGVFGLLLVYKVYREGDVWFLRTPEIQIFLFIILMYLLSAQFNAPDPERVKLLGPGFYFAEGPRLFINRVAFTLFFVVYIRTPAHVRMIFALAIAFMVFGAFSGVQNALMGAGFKGYRAAAEATFIRTAYNPNRLAMFSILAIAGVWNLAQSIRRPFVRPLALATIGMLGLAVFMTASRSGLVGLAICAAALLLDGGLDVRKLFSFLLAAALLVVLVAQFVPERNLERIVNLPGVPGADSDEGGGSLERRQYVWEIVPEMIGANPFLGVGMGNWAIARFLTDPAYQTTSAHNSFLLALVEGGMLCLGGFVLLFTRVWRNLRAAERYITAPGSPLGELTWVVKTVKVNFVVFLFYSWIADIWSLVTMFLLVGLSVVMYRLVQESEERSWALAG